MDQFKDIRAYRVGWLLPFTDFLLAFPLLGIWAWRTTKGIRLDYSGDRKQIERDIKKGAFFITNHRDIILDASWLSLLLRCRYFIRPYMGIGNNLFAKKWIEHLVRFNRCFVVKRGAGAHAQLENAKQLSAYIRHLRGRHKSIWLAQREGRAKDSNDLTQVSVLHMLTMNNDDMVTGIRGEKGRVVFRLTPSINPEIDAMLAAHPEYRELPQHDQLQHICNIIDRRIHQGYEIYERGTDFDAYIESRLAKIELPNKDEAFLRERLYEMYNNPVINHRKSLKLKV